MTVHQTWLAADGSGKANVERPRRLWLGLPKKGGVVRLWPDEEVTLGLCVAEGIETALAASIGFGLAWATLDKSNMKALPVLDGIESLTLVADNDEDGGGQRAAKECAARWTEARREVRVWLAERVGRDFADLAADLIAGAAS